MQDYIRQSFAAEGPGCRVSSLNAIVHMIRRTHRASHTHKHRERETVRSGTLLLDDAWTSDEIQRLIHDQAWSRAQLAVSLRYVDVHGDRYARLRGLLMDAWQERSVRECRWPLPCLGAPEYGEFDDNWAAATVLVHPAPWELLLRTPAMLAVAALYGACGVRMLETRRICYSLFVQFHHRLRHRSTPDDIRNGVLRLDLFPLPLSPFLAAYMSLTEVNPSGRGGPPSLPWDPSDFQRTSCDGCGNPPN